MSFAEVICPNCGAKLKIDLDRKFQDCPYCRFEFMTKDMNVQATSAKPGLSLADKLKQKIDK